MNQLKIIKLHMKHNRYLLLLDNQYSHEKTCIELFNESYDPDCYTFYNPAFPDDLKFGTYDYRLILCWYDKWEIIWRPDLNETLIKVFDSVGGLICTRCMADLKAESGMLEFKPESPKSPFVVMESASGLWIYGDK